VVICMDDDDFYVPEVRKLPVRLEFLIRKKRWDPLIFYRLRRTVSTFRPHIIHTNSWMTSFYALPIAKLFSIKLINGSIRNAFSSGGMRWKLEKLLLHLSDYRLANSKAGLLSRGLTLDSPRNVVVYNGLDYSRIGNLESIEPQNADTNKKKVVGMVAEFNRYKDYATFIDMARQVASRRRDVIFVAVGDGETLEASKAMAAGIADMKFLGKVRNIEPIVRTFDIGVLTTFTEGISNSIMEYMAFGKPVVATDGGGTRELITDGETGFLVPPKCPDILAAKIEYLLDNSEIARDMGVAGEAALRRRFSSERMVEETVALYKLAVANVRKDTFCARV
jgi:glycosyltransferase involved in cell wall biosynthesis